ncbi:hypothetical protein C8J57DRAFT_1719707 [Mycena rebaudengoi]|nr:hypothetical protein C8J57DRAFT_1719707 [Mycena rebaudengoi]
MVFNSYFEAKFGNRYETAWLPNSFGITAEAGDTRAFTYLLGFYRVIPDTDDAVCLRSPDTSVVLLSKSMYGRPRATSYASRCCVPRQSSTPSTFTRLHETHNLFPPRLLYPATSSYTPPHFCLMTYDPRAAQRNAYPRSPTNSLPSPAIPHPLHTYHGGLRGQIPPYRCEHGAHGGVYKASFAGAEVRAVACWVAISFICALSVLF